PPKVRANARPLARASRASAIPRLRLSIETIAIPQLATLARNDCPSIRLIRARPRRLATRPRPAHNFSRRRASVLAVAQHLHAVHEHLFDTTADLVRLFWRREVDDSFVIEHHDVGEHALPQQAAIAQAESRRDRAAHLAHRFLEREQLLLANVHAEDARIAPVRSRV